MCVNPHLPSPQETLATTKDRNDLGRLHALNLAVVIGSHAMSFESAPHLAAWGRRAGMPFDIFDSPTSIIRAHKALRIALRERDIEWLKQSDYVAIMMDESTSYKKKFIVFYARQVPHASTDPPLAISNAVTTLP